MTSSRRPAQPGSRLLHCARLAAPASAARGTSLPRRRPTLSLSSFASSRLLSKAQSSRTCRGHLWRGAASAEYLLLAPPPQLSTPCANRILPSRCVRPPLARCLLRQHSPCASSPCPANQRSCYATQVLHSLGLQAPPTSSLMSAQFSQCDEQPEAQIIKNCATYIERHR